jgi:hypothetical protein
METPGTIRAFFIFFGLIDTFMNWPTEEGHEVAWLALLGLIRGISYLCVGLALSALLRRQTWVVESVLIGGMCYSFLLTYARIFLYQEKEPIAEAIWRLISAAFLTLYVSTMSSA